VAYSWQPNGRDGGTLRRIWRLRHAARWLAAFGRCAIGAEGSRCGLHGLVYWPVCRRAIAVALVVGTILMLINQADVLLTGHASALVVAKIGLTYLVPFSVSTYSALAANRIA
jgi:hypothetical protein